MPDYLVHARKTGVMSEVTVTAESREDAAMQVAKGCAVGETVDIMGIEELPTAGATGTTGTTGATGR